MFSLARQTALRRLATRSFSSRAVYIANLSPRTTEDQLREVLAPFGKVTGMRFGEGREGYRYAHVYFGAGEPPVVDGPTHAETQEVEAAVYKVVGSLMGSELDGNKLLVRKAIDRITNPDLRDLQRARAEPGTSKDKPNDFNRGYALGYRQGITDGRNMPRAALSHKDTPRQPPRSTGSTSGDSATDSTRHPTPGQTEEEQAIGFDEGFRDGFAAGFKQGRRDREELLREHRTIE
ncbi:hypothetical protein DL89DRAFT_291862 [Linderina pennispora]|uniref:RRM domain-containing protein n=1 Tax=Linderina pennispora TaxID=61395 RepID=A0A1Y1WCS3_9FUNG|nr:uncharacterized protein DL89DRAFT_291862 [Linderina pennispora]ORX71340.1 hypothetical protein DL89DRAFT_291862 [Linderina pennispora]